MRAVLALQAQPEGSPSRLSVSPLGVDWLAFAATPAAAGAGAVVVRLTVLGPERRT